MKNNEEKNEEVMVENDAQVVAEEELKEVDLGSGSQESRHISISASLTEKEKSKLVLLLKEFKDVFAWDYSEMPGLDLGLIAHTLNVDPQAGPLAGQASGPACQDISDRNRGANSQGSAKIASRRIHQAYSTPALAIQHSTSKEEKWPDKMLCKFQKFQQSLSERRVPIAKHGFTNRFCGRKRHVFVYGWFQ